MAFSNSTKVILLGKLEVVFFCFYFIVDNVHTSLSFIAFYKLGLIFLNLSLSFLCMIKWELSF